MSDIQATVRTVNGQRLGSGLASFLDPFYLFKGKHRAAATRSRARKAELNLQYIGLAIKRYSELELLFGRLGIELVKAKDASRDLDPNRIPAPAAGDVQRGLLG